MKLNQLADNPGARRPPKRVGRGGGSGTGKTAGRGQKGQKSRSGASITGFEGGQMPIYRRLPKRGFNTPFAKSYNAVNLSRIQQAVEQKRLDAAKPVTAEALLAAGLVRRLKDGVRLIGKDGLKTKLAFEVDHASKGAVAAIENVGGSVLTKQRKGPAGPDKPGEASG